MGNIFKCSVIGMIMDEKENEEVKEREDLTSKVRENPWIASTIILGLAFLVVLFLILKPGITGNVVSEGNAADKLVGFLNSRVQEGEVSLEEVEDKGNFYLVTVSYQGDKIPVYVTKDGDYYTSQLVPLASATQQQNQQQNQQEIPKSDNPKVELFVMTHCPYGTQAEKGFVPVLEEFEDLDGKIRFVHYFMHGDKEEKETYRQVCIREEQSSEYLDYLRCFLEDGDSERCLDDSNINTVALESCIENKAEDYYLEDSELSNQYGVRGSPTLVIDGMIVSSGRSPEALKEVICSAFNSPPEGCELEFSSETPSAMWGWDAGQETQAQC
jgi:glutaredoxin